MSHNAQQEKQIMWPRKHATNLKSIKFLPFFIPISRATLFVTLLYLCAKT